jgi:hypothetical protein
MFWFILAPRIRIITRPTRPAFKTLAINERHERTALYCVYVLPNVQINGQTTYSRKHLKYSWKFCWISDAQLSIVHLQKTPFLEITRGAWNDVVRGFGFTSVVGGTRCTFIQSNRRRWWSRTDHPRVNVMCPSTHAAWIGRPLERPAVCKALLLLLLRRRIRSTQTALMVSLWFVTVSN